MPVWAGLAFNGHHLCLNGGSFLLFSSLPVVTPPPPPAWPASSAAGNPHLIPPHPLLLLQVQLTLATWLLLCHSGPTPAPLSCEISLQNPLGDVSDESSLARPRDTAADPLVRRLRRGCGAQYVHLNARPMMPCLLALAGGCKLAAHQSAASAPARRVERHRPGCKGGYAVCGRARPLLQSSPSSNIQRCSRGALHLKPQGGCVPACARYVPVAQRQTGFAEAIGDGTAAWTTGLPGPRSVGGCLSTLPTSLPARRCVCDDGMQATRSVRCLATSASDSAAGTGDECAPTDTYMSSRGPCLELVRAATANGLTRLTYQDDCRMRAIKVALV